MTQDEINQAEWADPANWSAGFLGVYASARDTRVWVPKRQPWMGWTVNLGHAAGRWSLAGLIGVPLAVAAAVVALTSRR